MIEELKEWRDARAAVLDHQIEFEKTKKGMEVTNESAKVHIVLLRRLADAEHKLMQVANNIGDNMDKPIMHGLWRDDPSTPEGKYLVKRRDGSVVEWPHFTIGAKDPCASAALKAYACQAERLGLTQGYADSVWKLADEFEAYRLEHGDGDPDRGRHRIDDPDTINEMKKGRSV